MSQDPIDIGSQVPASRIHRLHLTHCWILCILWDSFIWFHLRLPLISAYLCSPIKVYVTPIVGPTGFSLPPLLLASSMVLLCLLWKIHPQTPLHFDLDATALLRCTWVKCGGKENLLCHWLKPLYPWGPVASMRSRIVRGSFWVPASALDGFVIPALIFCLG